MHPSYPRATDLDGGFSLIEVMIAAVLLATSLTALAELFATSVRNNAVARYGTASAVLAAQKVEQLRVPAALVPSGGNTLQVNTDGYMDYTDSSGAILGTDVTTIPDGTAYIRRWSIEPVQGTTAVVIQVLVTRRRNRGAADSGAVARAPEEARLVTVRRQGP
jgi:prepilin-type N-terminal cleavage/methylation domain-containing protein